MKTYDDVASDETYENGTTTTLLGAHDDGTVTLVGTNAMLDAGNETIPDDGIDQTIDVGTELGTLV